MEDWITIRNLKKRNPGMGTRKIAKKLGLSRNTVRNALKSENPPEYKRETYTSCTVKIPIIERTKYINYFMQVKPT